MRNPLAQGEAAQISARQEAWADATEYALGRIDEFSDAELQSFRKRARSTRPDVRSDDELFRDPEWVFLSYRHRDTNTAAQFTERLKGRLGPSSIVVDGQVPGPYRQPPSVGILRRDPDDLPWYFEFLTRRMSQCSVLVALLTEDWAYLDPRAPTDRLDPRNDGVHREIAEALRAQMPMVYVRPPGGDSMDEYGLVPHRTVTLDAQDPDDFMRIAHVCLFLRPFGVQMMRNLSIRTDAREGIPHRKFGTRRYEVLPGEWYEVRHGGAAGYTCNPCRPPQRG